MTMLLAQVALGPVGGRPDGRAVLRPAVQLRCPRLARGEEEAPAGLPRAARTGDDSPRSALGPALVVTK